jgi:tRNA nucleotidyltransferase/poly(A) polymerase
MKFLSRIAISLGVAEHIYIVGGAVRNHLLGLAPKDIDVVVDSLALGGKDSDWFARQIAKDIPAQTNLTTNQYGVAILTVKSDWFLDEIPMKGEVIEIANARKESYGESGGKGKGYKPTDVQPATIEEDVYRREFTFNTLLWRLLDLAEGPDKAEVIDLTGLGKSHLEQKLIHTPLDPDKTFGDDPTRMLRAIKFLIKYDLEIAPPVAASIRQNAEKMKQMPWEAVATILVRDILGTPSARESLLTMASLGLIDTLADMIRDERPFAAYMAGQFTQNRNVGLLLDLADLGLGSKPVDFLTKIQQIRLREITTPMDRDEASEFFDRLRKPAINSVALIEEFKLEGRERGEISKIAIEAILASPILAYHPDRLQAFVRDRLASR